MSDEIDLTDAREEVLQAARLENAHRNAVLDPGHPGECALCGEESMRLVRNTCCRCRDKFRLP